MDWIIGLVSGLVSSVTFFLLMRSLSPKVVVSPYIAKEMLGGKMHFTFKVVNLGRRGVINLQVSVQHAQPKGVDGGQIFVTTPIPIKRDKVFAVGKYFRSDKGADYAVRFATDHDLEVMWANEAALLRFRLFATDAVSGNSRVFTQEFHHRRCIKAGSHGWGKSLEVIENE